MVGFLGEAVRASCIQRSGVDRSHVGGTWQQHHQQQQQQFLHWLECVFGEELGSWVVTVEVVQGELRGFVPWLGQNVRSLYEQPSYRHCCGKYRSAEMQEGFFTLLLGLSLQCLGVGGALSGCVWQVPGLWCNSSVPWHRLGVELG